MKPTKLFTIALIAICIGVTTTGCRSRQTVDQTLNPFRGNTHQPPCFMLSCAQYFAATGIASGSRHQVGTTQRVALTNAQDMIRQMMEHAYEGFVDSYFESIGTGAGTDIEAQTRAVGRQTIMQVVGVTDPICLQFSDVDDRGNVTVYIGVRIPRQRVATAIADNLSRDERAEIRERAAEMREEMNEHFKNIEGE